MCVGEECQDSLRSHQYKKNALFCDADLGHVSPVPGHKVDKRVF